MVLPQRAETHSWLPSAFSSDGHSVRLGSVRDESPMSQKFEKEPVYSSHPTYQRFTGTLEHVADILAQSRLRGLPTNKAEVINMLYTLEREEVGCLQDYDHLTNTMETVLCFHTFINFSFTALW